MFKKIGIPILIVTAFIAGGIALNAIKVDAGFGNNEEFKVKMQEFKEMTPEQRQEHKMACMESEDCVFSKMGRMQGLKKWGEEVNHEVVNIENGIQITITSDNPDIVEKLQNRTEKFNK